VDKGHSSLLLLANRFESKKFLNPTNQMDPFHKVKTDLLKNISFLGAMLLNLKFVGGP
jgi:hypothetical protein